MLRPYMVYGILKIYTIPNILNGVINEDVNIVLLGDAIEGF